MTTPNINAAEDMGPMRISLFRNKSVSIARQLSVTWSYYLKRFAKHSHRKDKDGLMFSPVSFQRKRSNLEFIAAFAICLDFDHGQPTVEQVLAVFPETAAAYYSTHSHTPDLPRFRVVLPLSRCVNAEEHQLLVRGVKSILPPDLKECLDATCLERARAHYLPSCPPGQKHHTFTDHQDGQALDVDYFMRLGTMAAPSEVPGQLKPLPANRVEFVDCSTGEVTDLAAWAAQNSTFDIVAAISPQHRRGNLKDGKQHIDCPFESEHTDQGVDLATFVANASPPEHASWDIHCCHGHCVGRDRLQFLLAMLEKGWIRTEQLSPGEVAAIEVKRPPRVYFPVKDVLAAPEWSSLLPDELRMALHLMTMMWGEDGTIADDDWMIARRLAIPSADWKVYRETLKRTGWLVECGGRLTSCIPKNEFDRAEAAYRTFIQRASAGGRTTQEKARQKMTG